MPTNTSISVPIANGAVSVPMAQGAKGQLELLLIGAAPTAGTLKIEGLQWAGGAYQVLQNATAINLATALAGGAAIALTEHGHYRALRFTFTGVTGGSGNLTGLGYMTDGAIADLAFQGQRALNVQGYVESNVKLGLQFYFQYMLPTLAGGGTNSVKIAFRTGAQPVLIKDRSLYALGNSVALQLFKSPTGISGGTVIPVQNYNDIIPQASTVTVLGGVTTATNGTAWGDPTHIYGANTVGNRIGSGLAPGADRVLAPNHDYLIVVTNLDTTTGTGGQALCDYYLTWYEGAPDLPRQ